MESNIEFFKGKKILITGGGGYLGSKLAETFVQYDAKLSLMDISFNSLSEKLIEHNSNIKKYPVDITNKSGLEIVCKEVEPEYIFHFCALLNRERDFKHYNKLYEVNVQGTLNLLESLRSIDYKGFYYSSSSEVYGTKNPSPFHEEQLPSPASPYSLTKLMAENLIQTYSELHYKPNTILRIFNFFGSDMPENFFISQLIASLKASTQFDMTGGEQVRDFIFIDDLLDAILGIILLKESNGETFNICSGIRVKLKELAFEIAQLMGKTHLLNIGGLPYRENEVWEMVGSRDKLNKIIKWVPTTSLINGIQKIVGNL